MDENVYRIAPMFILPEYQGNGYAQQALTEYVTTGKEEQIQENMTIVFYAKKDTR